jgi:hypothetical protein
MILWNFNSSFQKVEEVDHTKDGVQSLSHSSLVWLLIVEEKDNDVHDDYGNLQLIPVTFP